MTSTKPDVGARFTPPSADDGIVATTATYEATPDASAIETDRQQSSKIRLYSLLVMAAVSVGLLWLNTLESLLPARLMQLADRLLDGIFVFCFAGFFSETKPFKSYVESRIRQTVLRSDHNIRSDVAALVRSDFVSRVENESFLRQFDEKTLQRIERKIRRATFAPDHPPDIDSFLNALQSVRQRLDILRANYVEKLIVELLPEHPNLIRVTAETSWVYLNYSIDKQPKQYRQRYTEIINSVPGIADLELYHMIGLQIGGEDLLDRTPITCTARGDLRAFEGETVVTLAPATSVADGVTYWDKFVCLRARSRPWVQRFYHPVHTIDLTCHYPAGFDPALNVFGVGSSAEKTDPMEPVDTYENHHGGTRRWVYDGWLLPNHGFIVSLAGQ